jgi:glucosamine--fructose-6-phosphate aminotransferase (isomerizing)
MNQTANKYHMRDEIGEQPAVLETLIAKYVKGTRIESDNLTDYLDKLKSIERVTFIGCGSSFNAGLLGNYIFEEITGLPCEYEFADEFVDRNPVIEFGTTFIALSQSGRTGDTLDAVKHARESGAFIISITNTPDSELSKLSHLHLYTEAGEEKGIEATKSYTATLVLELILALTIAQEQNVAGHTSVEIVKKLKSLPDKIRKTIELEQTISKYAMKIHEQEHMVILGRKFNYPTALEASQKIKETSYLDSEAYASEEFLHGPSAIIEPGFPVLIIMPDDSVCERNMAVAEELIKIKAGMVVITDMEKCCISNADCWQIPDTHEVLIPILNTIVFQLLAFHLGVAKGIDVNKPRNIQKFIA